MSVMTDLFKKYALTPELKEAVANADRLYIQLENENRELRNQAEKSQSDTQKYRRQIKKLSD